MRRTPRSIFVFWAPLAATWMMMALEGPFLAALIARLSEPTYNLAAWGVAYAFAILVEAPVIMLLSASTALVEDAASYRRLRNFTHALNVGCSALLLTVLIPPVYDGVMRTVLALPAPVADVTYGALWIFLPWPAAIGYRRFLQGILIRTGRTRLVAVGTAIRLAAMTVTGLVLYAWGGIPGAWVGAASLSAGVLVEAVAARLMAAASVRELQRPDMPGARHLELGYREIARFYYPLALTSVIGLTVQPMLTFFMGRATAPVASLAVFPVVQALSFLFRAPGLAYQEVSIALLGRRCEHLPELARFAAGLAAASTAAMALVTFTPLADVWFEGISGLTPELAAFAVVPARVTVPLAAASVFISLQRGVLMQGRRTGSITVASALDVLAVAALFVAIGWGLDWVGVTAAMAAFLGGRLVAIVYLFGAVRRVLEKAARSLQR